MLISTGCPAQCCLFVKIKRPWMSVTSSNKKAWRVFCVDVLSFIFSSIISAERNPTVYGPRREFLGP